MTIALAIVITALLGAQRSFAQTAVEALPRAGAPIPNIGAPNLDSINTNPSAGRANDNQDQPAVAPESDTQTPDTDSSDNNSSDSGGWSQVQPGDPNSDN